MKWWLGGVAVLGLAVVGAAGSAQGAMKRPALAPWRLVRPGRYWSWEELTVSATAVRLGLDNTPGPEAQANLRRLCAEVLDPLRERWPEVRVNSAFRTPAVNRAVGGVVNSRHLVGSAVDLALPPEERPAVVAWLKRRGAKVLAYRTHIHVAAPHYS